ncbi:MAG: radical SAM protein [Deltaproteobacteria bacterium]|nr:radical SAM protein [Deltaproteobacteria bacterium]
MIKVALIFPNRYHLAMSNLGFQRVYELFNQAAGVVCERAFLPDPDEEEEYLRTGSRLITLESQSQVADFHLIAFSVSFESDYLNLVRILKLAGLEAGSRDRAANDPLVLAGGVAVMLNPEPLADFVDLFLLGEAEVILTPFLEAVKRLNHEDVAKPALLRQLGMELPFAYVPSGYHPVYDEHGGLIAFEPEPGFPDRIRSSKLTEFGRRPPVKSVILTPDTEFKSMPLVEIGRGCGFSCRFCAAGYIYRPPRHLDQETCYDTVIPLARDHPRLGLVSPDVAGIPGIAHLGQAILQAGGKFSVSSVRADGLPPELIQALLDSGDQVMTIAPDAGSERLRRVINKHLTEEQILAGAEKIIAAGILNLKLYFMIGLPTEEKEDVEALTALVKKIKHRLLKVYQGKKRIGTITVSLNCFVPKPFTPFQWTAFASVKELKDRISMIKKSLEREPNVRVNSDLPKWTYVQALLARGDRRVGRIMAAAAAYDGDYVRAFKESPVNPDYFVSRERAEDELFPWDFIDHGLTKSFLWREYQAALAGKETPWCDVGKCLRCGVCRPDQEDLA